MHFELTYYSPQLADTTSGNQAKRNGLKPVLQTTLYTHSPVFLEGLSVFKIKVNKLKY
jgi:hypothetical protein